MLTTVFLYFQPAALLSVPISIVFMRSFGTKQKTVLFNIVSAGKLPSGHCRVGFQNVAQYVLNLLKYYYCKSTNTVGNHSSRSNI